MLESVLLQKNRLRSAKNVIFSLLSVLVDRPMGGFNPQTPLAYALDYFCLISALFIIKTSVSFVIIASYGKISQKYY